ncbi:MAG TPA: hypothetical protein VK760_06110, partial [Candidatus Acidoferrales bacterium]|nr:hypothetical protein [Candidatus Acidoferrales bacterium]
MRHAHILLALALIGAAPCAPATLPIGTWTYGRIAITPPQSASIQRDGSAVVVDDFPADRAFTTTASRYDESTLDLRSARQHASCCANEWSAIVTRSADGSYEVVAKHLAPGGGNMKVTVQRAHIPASGR